MNAPVVLRDGLELHGPGGVFVPAARALVIADVHVGYTATLRARGYGVPVAEDAGLMDRVRSLLARTAARRVVIAGDLAHGAGSARGADASPLARFLGALGTHEVDVVLGNHDRHVDEWLRARSVSPTRELVLGPHRIHHGDDVERVRALREQALCEGGRVLLGHLHPAVSVAGEAGVSALLPAFVTARGLVCLPALSPYARGVDVADARMRAELRALVGDEDLGAACVVGEKAIALGVIRRGR